MSADLLGVIVHLNRAARYVMYVAFFLCFVVYIFDYRSISRAEEGLKRKKGFKRLFTSVLI